jgi:threonine/homoserine/homoserine lactone efflux protein
MVLESNGYGTALFMKQVLPRFARPHQPSNVCVCACVCVCVCVCVCACVCVCVCVCMCVYAML